MLHAAADQLAVTEVLAVGDDGGTGVDVARRNLRQEREVGHVRVGVHHRDHAARLLDASLQLLGEGEADVAATHDEKARSVLSKLIESHAPEFTHGAGLSLAV